MDVIILSAILLIDPNFNDFFFHEEEQQHDSNKTDDTKLMNITSNTHDVNC